MQIKEKIITSGSLHLWTQKLVDEKASRNPCILISGAGASAMFWTDQFCALLVEAGYPIIRFDHRDQGLSDAVDWKKTPYTLDDLAQDVIHILNAYRIPKAHIIGHSMGGTVAQLLAVQYPHRLLSYTSMSVSTIGSTEEPDQTILNALLENKPIQQFKQDLAGFMRSWNMLNGDYKIDHDRAKHYTEDLYIRSKHKVGVAWNHIRCQKNYPSFSKKIKSITMPGLFIHGEKDPLILVEGAIRAHHLIPHSKIVVIPGMGHMFFNTDLETDIANYIIEHLNHVETKKST